MSCLQANFVVHESNCVNFTKSSISRGCSSIGAPQMNRFGITKTLDFPDQNSIKHLNITTPKSEPTIAQPSNSGWWEKSLKPNMVEIKSAQQLVDLLQNAEDTLVVLSFYSHGCGGCRTLHPKICQMAETNPKAMFAKINYDNHKTMCSALHVHVLPFFKFYRGSPGRLCSFSCTNATIKKFKDAMGKHGTDRCSIGRTQGLNEEEMATLGSLGLISSDDELVLNYGEEDGSLILV